MKEGERAMSSASWLCEDVGQKLGVQVGKLTYGWRGQEDKSRS
jgi:hypothetical protein